MLLGLVKPTTGTATVLGESIENPARYIDRVGALVEAPAMYPKLSGYKNLLALAHLSGLPARRIDEVLDIVDLSSRAHDRYDNYSLGMKQRLAIAGALLQEPQVLMFDEPTNGLDPAGTVEMRALFRRLADGGTSVIVSSHLLAEMQAACDRLIVIQKGKLVFAGPLDELLAAQLTTVTAIAETPAEAARLATAVERAGKIAAIDGCTVTVSVDPKWSVELGRLALTERIVLSELRSSVPNLETTFLEMTGASTGRNPDEGAQR